MSKNIIDLKKAKPQPAPLTPAEMEVIADSKERERQLRAELGESSGLEAVEQEGPRVSAASRLVGLVEGFRFFYDQQRRAFVQFEVQDHLEVWPVNSTPFRNFLSETFYRRTEGVINRNAIADAVAALAGRACYDGPELPVFMRVARSADGLLIDLCDPQWRAVEVTPTGWRVLEKSPVAFTRTSAMRSLPMPAPASKGSLDPLWELLNLSESQRPLLAGAVLNGFHPDGPFFVVHFVGEQGTGKSSSAKMLRLLIDPNEIPLRSPPRDERDLLIHAANNWFVVLDNLSHLPAWLSDGLCRLSTGGGHSARQLFTDGDEFTLSVKRPVILTGIDDVATRPDLAERALQIELSTIPDDLRAPESEIWPRFEAARPVIFAGILNALVCALRELPNLKLTSLPRMADAAAWATAGESAFGWQQGTFIEAYLENLNDGATASLDGHPVGIALRRLLDSSPTWTGEATALLEALGKSATEALRQQKAWPQNPRSLSAALRRLAQAVRRGGIGLEFGRGTRRVIRLCRQDNFASRASFSPTSTDATTQADAKIQPLHAPDLVDFLP